MKYSEIRSLIRVGDNIGCRSQDTFGRVIRFFRGGKYNLSHIAVVIRDVGNEGTGSQKRQHQRVGAIGHGSSRDSVKPEG